MGRVHMLGLEDIPVGFYRNFDLICWSLSVGFGGYGFTSRKWGLTLDTIQALDVVLANGTIVTASNSNYPDLFWVCIPLPASFLRILMIFFRLFVDHQVHSELSPRSMQQLLPLPRLAQSSNTTGISLHRLPPPPLAPSNPSLSARRFHRNLVLSSYSAQGPRKVVSPLASQGGGTHPRINSRQLSHHSWPLYLSLRATSWQSALTLTAYNTLVASAGWIQLEFLTRMIHFTRSLWWLLRDRPCRMLHRRPSWTIWPMKVSERIQSVTLLFQCLFDCLYLAM